MRSHAGGNPCSRLVGATEYRWGYSSKRLVFASGQSGRENVATRDSDHGATSNRPAVSGLLNRVCRKEAARVQMFRATRFRYPQKLRTPLVLTVIVAVGAAGLQSAEIEQMH